MATEITLRDGSTVLVRPVDPSDKDLIRTGFERLSPDSRYRRFLSAASSLNKAALRYLTEVDHHDHEALIAMDPRSQEAVGVARFIRGGRPDVAEAAVTVADDWQGRGLGTMLLELLAARAREESVARFSALVLAANDDIIELLQRLGPVEVVGRDGPTVELELELPSAPMNADLKALVRELADARSPMEPVGPLVPHRGQG